jgi:hypothetical protein
MRARDLLRGRRAWLAAGSALAVLAGVLAAGTVLSDLREPPAPPAVSPPAGEGRAEGRDRSTEVEAAPASSPAAAASQPAPVPRAEEHLMERLRAAVDDQPTLALAIADEGDASFSAGPLSDERSYLRMRALVHLGDIGKARTVAGEFFQRHPQSPYGSSVYRLTGMRPRHIGPPS